MTQNSPVAVLKTTTFFSITADVSCAADEWVPAEACPPFQGGSLAPTGLRMADGIASIVGLATVAVSFGELALQFSKAGP